MFVFVPPVVTYTEGRRISQEIGAAYAVVVYPFLYQLDERYPFRELHDNVRDACTDAGIPFHDLLADFEGHAYADLWVHPSDQHPNEEGQRIAAEAVARFVLDAQLLGGREDRQ